MDAYASGTHYVDHLAPIWLALDQRRGQFRVGPGRGLLEHCARWGIMALRGRPTANPTLVASYADERACQGPVALLEHGAGQTYDTPDPDAVATRHQVELYLAPNQLVADRMAPVLPHARRLVVGSPRLEHLAGLERNPRWVALAWHWNQWGPAEARTAWGHYQHWLGDWARQVPDLVGHAHPRMLRSIRGLYLAHGIEVVSWANELLAGARVLVADNTSLLWEACALDIPVVVLDAPWYRIGVHHGLRFWEWADVGPRIRDAERLPEAVAAAPSPEWAPVRRAAAEAIYGPLEGSIDRALAALKAWR